MLAGFGFDHFQPFTDPILTEKRAFVRNGKVGIQLGPETISRF
jgi:hypothetical protein